MLFNSLDFAVFLPIVFVLYWFVFKNQLKAQNILIVIASYIFYGWWDWRFLSLIAFSTIVDFFIGRKLSNESNSNNRKLLLWTSIFVNLGFLGFFKYYNFFLDNFITAFSFFGNEIKANSLNIILPVGISFYTFQTLSYTIDVYRKKLKPTSDFFAFTAFVSFFPQLVAGPIERATNLLPQFYKKRTFDYRSSIDGLRQILWGLFKKIVIADNCAVYANLIFNNSDDYSGSTLILGAIFFTFQIYGDFSGYSDIAIGTSRLFGFDLKQNFAFPYFSRNIAEFWRRWHISLSSWFKDYVYIPLGGSRGGILKKIKNTFIIFVVSGFWHGANWTFIIWGALNAIYFLPLLLTNRNRNYIEIVANNKFFPNFKEIIQMLVTFSLTILAWIFFRANNVGHAFSILEEVFSKSTLSIPSFEGFTKSMIIILMIFFFISVEWLGRRGKFALEKIYVVKFRFIRWSFYLLLVIIIIIFGASQQDFIYFQF
ncbi:MBOAT family O-acyltransferase [Flavivirga aquimarina]|uniref:MBOAT family O-acyltransferase n=1 Tax=Flavivirga aquimarina TaxID=2027862 RepID=A0ABT8WDA7_9FLAO|nr:MBOAT family O-acyltransferase [Flavivirga aquimarina]MDO5971121.1 MBOAT family O-acyltransferase [Flavivirga aquimarina]